MDLFMQHGMTSAPARPQRGNAAGREPSAFDLKMAEKQRLSRAYRVWARQSARAAFDAEPRLADFYRYLRTVKAEHGDELIEAIETSWLPASSQAVRILALRMVDRRCDRINRAYGIAPLDDPTPPDTSVYFRARHILHAGGRA